MFSTQIVKFGEIRDFECANSIWNKILEKEWNWEELDKEFREVHNSVLTDFRKVTTKE